MRRLAYDITKTSMMLALALVLSILEAWLLPRGILPIPGFKLGLANIAILVTLYSVGKKEALLVAVLRSLVILFFGGNLIGFLFSLLGGIFAWGTMCLLCGRHHVSIFGVSIAGAAAHGIGQILAALWVMRTVYVITYLPYLVLAGCVAGALIAFLTIPIVKALDHIGNEMIQ
ncbi:MAG: Gx transporter family protein [Saccharofermentanaceae bacterium]|nr:Gx transporter family protein [Saccharofermentanaceae bacterium]